MNMTEAPPYYIINFLPVSKMFCQAFEAHLHSTSHPLLELWKQTKDHQNLTLKWCYKHLHQVHLYVWKKWCDEAVRHWILYFVKNWNWSSFVSQSDKSTQEGKKWKMYSKPQSRHYHNTFSQMNMFICNTLANSVICSTPLDKQRLGWQFTPWFSH
jgi:hypothetical protein